MSGIIVALLCAVALLAAFFLGSIPCGVLVGKVVYGIDPRDSGSHSIGATNVNRTMGTKAGVGVMLLDMLKGVVGVGVARIIAVFALGWAAGSVEFDALVYGAVFFGIAGHIYSPWLGFKGGKGISTGFGTLITADWRIGVGIGVVFLIVAIVTRIVSVGSMMAAVSVAVWAVVFHWGSLPCFVFCLLVSVMVVYAHRANIKRLIAGEEPKFSTKKSADHKER